MKNQKKRSFRENNDGAALIVAIIVIAVVMVFAATLLVVSYSLYASAQHKNLDIKSRELAQSVADELTKEITEIDFDSYADQAHDENNGQDDLWFYLRYNVWQGYETWPYYNEEESGTGHGLKRSTKYYNIAAGDMADDISVMMRWEKPKLKSVGGAEDPSENEKTGTMLHVYVQVKMKDATYNAIRHYMLNVEEYEDAAAGGTTTTSDTKINPYGNTIVSAEKWRWDLSEN